MVNRTMEDGDLAASVEALVAAKVGNTQPGCVVGLYRGRELVHAAGFGLAELSTGAALGAESLFNIASTSKQFTAFALLLLAEDGAVGLEDPVRRYIPELPSYADAVCLRHLLHHTAGLRDYVALWRLNGRAFSDRVEKGETLALIAAQEAPNAPAGTDYSYNNTGYFLLSLVVERASGRSLAEFSRARIFAPLGMASTVIVDRYPADLQNLAIGYSRDEDGGFGVDVSRWEPTGDGQVHTTICDLQRWHDNFALAMVGGKSALAALRMPGRLDDGRPLPYAGGLEIGRFGAHPAERHSGGWAGYRSEFLRLVDCDLSVAVLANRSDIDPSAIADAAARLALDERAPESPTERAHAGLRPGFYRNIRFTDHVAVDALDNGLVLDDGWEAQPLYIESGRIVAVEDGHLTLSGNDAELTIDSGDGWETYRPCERWSPDTAALANLAGRYSNGETGLAYEIVLTDGRLTAAGPLGPLALTPQGPLTFSTDGRPAFRFEDGDLIVDIGQRVRHVRFSRQG